MVMAKSSSDILKERDIRFNFSLYLILYIALMRLGLLYVFIFWTQCIVSFFRALIRNSRLHLPYSVKLLKKKKRLKMVLEDHVKSYAIMNINNHCTIVV